MNEIKKVKNPQTLDGLRVVQDIEEVVKTLENGETIARFEYGESMLPVFVVDNTRD